MKKWMIAITIVYMIAITIYFVKQRKNEICQKVNVAEEPKKEGSLKEKEEKLKQSTKDEPENTKNREELGKIYYQEGKVKESQIGRAHV